MVQLQPVEDPKRKADICNRILRSLPEWFGIEASIRDYVSGVQPLPFWAAMDGNAPAGFAALKPSSPFAGEVFVIGVAPAYHRQGIGRQLLARCVQACRAQNMRFLTVKTLDESAKSACYDRTRAFYLSMGFIPLETFPTLWDPGNPCLLMVMPL